MVTTEEGCILGICRIDLLFDTCSLAFSVRHMYATPMLFIIIARYTGSFLRSCARGKPELPHYHPHCALALTVSQGHMPSNTAASLRCLPEVSRSTTQQPLFSHLISMPSRTQGARGQTHGCQAVPKQGPRRRDSRFEHSKLVLGELSNR